MTRPPALPTDRDWLTPEEYNAYIAAQKPSKYRNEPIVVEGVRWDSTGEYGRWCELENMERAGAIANLRRQVPYPLEVNGVLVATYVADYVYDEGGREIVEDWKGVMTEGYRLKAKLMQACHGITIRVTGRGRKGR
jgi:hypothetical protein